MSKNMPNANWFWVTALVFMGIWYFLPNWLEAHYLPLILILVLGLVAFTVSSVVVHDRNVTIDNEKSQERDAKLDEIMERLHFIERKVDNVDDRI